MKLKNVELNEQERFRLKIMDAYEKMEPKNVRYLCRLMGIHHSTFYRVRKQYKRFNLNSLKLRSKRPKHTRTISWSLVIEICEWKRNNPAKPITTCTSYGLKRGEYLLVHQRLFTTGGRGET